MNNMKKYLMTCLIIVLFFIVYFYLSLYTSFYIKRYNSAKTFITAKGKDFYLNDDLFEIRAINLGSSIPGSSTSDYKISYEKYLEYFKIIQDANFNTIRVYNISSPEFYKALYDYNKNKKEPLYLIQSTDVGTYEKNSTYDYFSKNVQNDVLKNVKTMVDCVHGNRIVPLNKQYASGVYRYNVSDYVIGYLIGSDWIDKTVEYTNQLYKGDNSYEGKFLYTKSEATPFEKFLTEIGDNLIQYETYKYGTQKLVSFGNEALTDPFEYDESIMDYFNKFTKIDVEHISAKKNFKAGLFASYKVYSFYPDYYSTQKDVEDSYIKYLKQLNDYHKTPLLISEFGYSDSRATISPNLKITTEKEQGELIVEDIKKMKSVGINNYILYEFEDEWDNSIWNTSYATDISKGYLWHDVQTYNQGYGLLKYEALNAKKIDGRNTKEYGKENLLVKNNDYKLYVEYDYSYVYFYVESRRELKQLYIPIDTTQQSGSDKSNVGNLSFNRNVDFIIDLNAKDKDSRLYVQDYYNPIRNLFGKRVYSHDPYEKDNIPKKNSSNFEQILLLTSLQELITDKKGLEEFFSNKDIMPSYFVSSNTSTIETGYLKYDEDYRCTSNTCEIKIPWGMLNFYNPATKSVHDDYYEHYGVESINIDEMYFGVGNDKIELEPLKLKGWAKVKVKEKLKDSYYIIKDYLKGDD